MYRQHSQWVGGALEGGGQCGWEGLWRGVVSVGGRGSGGGVVSVGGRGSGGGVVSVGGRGSGGGWSVWVGGASERGSGVSLHARSVVYVCLSVCVSVSCRHLLQSVVPLSCPACLRTTPSKPTSEDLATTAHTRTPLGCVSSATLAAMTPSPPPSIEVLTARGSMTRRGQRTTPHGRRAGEQP